MNWYNIYSNDWLYVKKHISQEYAIKLQNDQNSIYHIWRITFTKITK